jgi:hypothetical protein
MDALWEEAKAAEQSPPPCGEGRGGGSRGST